MASRTYRLALKKTSGAVQNVDFTIPDTAGTYNLKLNLQSGGQINAGNIVVGYEANIYELKLVKASGKTISCGQFKTPSVAGTFTKAFPTVTSKNVEGIEVYHEYGTYAHTGTAQTATYRYTYTTITINGITLNANNQIVHTSTTTMSGNVTITTFSAKYRLGTLTLETVATLYNESADGTFVRTSSYTGTFTGQ
jgi:hypothetical protein